MHDWSRHSILSQSRVSLYEKYNTVVRHMTRAPYESAAAATSHGATDPAEFNIVCRSKSNLPNQTDSNAALLPYLTHQLGSAHEWSGVGPKTSWRKLYSLCCLITRPQDGGEVKGTLIRRFKVIPACVLRRQVFVPWTH